MVEMEGRDSVRESSQFMLQINLAVCLRRGCDYDGEVERTYYSGFMMTDSD